MAIEQVVLMPPESVGIIALFLSVTVTCLNASRILKDTWTQGLKKAVEELDSFKVKAKGCVDTNASSEEDVKKNAILSFQTKEARFRRACRWFSAWGWANMIPVILSPILAIALAMWVFCFLHTDWIVPSRFVLYGIEIFTAVLVVSLIAQLCSSGVIEKIYKTAVLENDNLEKAIFKSTPTSSGSPAVCDGAQTGSKNSKPRKSGKRDLT